MNMPPVRGASSKVEGVRLLLIGRNDASLNKLRVLLATTPSLQEVGATSDSSRAVEQARNRVPDVVLVEAESLPVSGMDVARSLLTEFSNVGVILIAAQSAAGLDRDAIRAGAHDFLLMPVAADELAKSILSAYDRVRQGASGHPGAAPGVRPGRAGEIITVASAKGGSGKSFIAASLAARLAAKHPGNVTLLDFAFQFGDVDLFLNLHGKKTIRSLSSIFSELSPEVMDEIYLKGADDLRVVLAPKDPDDARDFAAQDIEKLLRFVNRAVGFTVVDTASHVDDILLSCLRDSSLVLLVVNPDVISIRSNAKLVKHYRDLQYPLDRLQVVLNRRGTQDALDKGQIQKALGCRVCATIPEDHDTLQEFLNFGRSVAEIPDSGLSQSLQAMADSVVQFVEAKGA